jgi:hypothetical protein
VLYRLGKPGHAAVAARDVYAQHQRSELQALGRGDHVEAITGDELLERMQKPASPCSTCGPRRNLPPATCRGD